jgi:hypothetical protein
VSGQTAEWAPGPVSTLRRREQLLWRRESNRAPSVVQPLAQPHPAHVPVAVADTPRPPQGKERERTHALRPVQEAPPL